MRRRTAWFLAAGVAAVAVGAAAVGALAVWSQGRRGGPGGERHLYLRVLGDLRERPASAVESLFETEPPTVWALVESLDRAARDPQVTAAVLRIGQLARPGWGRAQELHRAVSRFRAAGKTAHALLEDSGNQEYYVATACSRIYAVPTALLNVSGLAAEVTFFREGLDMLGVEAQFEGVGRYKTAPSRFTDQRMSEADREQTAALLDSLYGQYVTAVAAARGRSEAEVRELIDRGPFTARDALDAGLVDELVYADELEQRLPAASRLAPLSYVRSVQDYWFDTRPKIALVYVVGDIVPGASRDGPFGTEGFAGADTVVAALRQARADGEVRAVILRVDSPGGVGTAADLIWREVFRTRQAKPVVVSMGDTAASGGYYVGMAADAVVAQPGTLTGSIGVFSGKFVLRGMYDKLGIRREILTRGRNAALFSEYRPWDGEDRARIRSLNQAFYEEFLRKAAEGRGRPRETIEAAAEGRVWTGAQALEQGLVDRLGGLSDALEEARARARIAPGQDVAVVVLPERRGLLETLFAGRDDGLSDLTPGAVAVARRWARLLEFRGPLARLPYDVHIR